jgi:ketopantoate hydroxymethyltransferase
MERIGSAMNVLDFQKMKDVGRKISMVTCYDYSSARAVAESSIDCILVGDSVAMTMHGFSNTLSATYANAFDIIQAALNAYYHDVKSGSFPKRERELFSDSPVQPRRGITAEKVHGTHAV